ncbi:TIGR01777 family oxidoreductase [Tamlana sp. 62-3]|uniref:TIGR01777 family oxidoreductase n=1 Tax=Neotamlana sargassicola TaxID=2883125 RepID=A0A9X1I8W2_9FLAO|nr:TIGR01777 family oxidoreductase [Tamlana sargassicola]MCB4809427.1 TIGR01777 family oxidoreductase [Tamlana sargassicola]
MRVLITGATGLVGSEIVKLCKEKEIAVNYLTTNKSKLERNTNYQGFYWNPSKGEIDVNCLEQVDTIIHLAGANIAKRWTTANRKIILDSRTQSAKLLFETLKTEKHQVKHFISASAIGIYPDSLTNYYSEDDKNANTTFLAKVVTAWEASANAFKTLNINVAKIRIGLVLAKNGGALVQMVKPAKYGLSAPFGIGKQWQSWIHITDLARCFMYVLKYKLDGVYNAVAPNPVTNKELTKTIAKTLEMPCFLPGIPKIIMKLALGEMHIILFESQRVSAKKMENKGFNFKYNYLQPALSNILS